MPSKLQVSNNFKFKFLFGDQVPRKTLAPHESISFDVPKSNHMGEQRS
jgi:hypothetical protein